LFIAILAIDLGFIDKDLVSLSKAVLLHQRYL